MKPHLFWTMLFSFVLVIVLGVCGMLVFFGLAVNNLWQPAEWARTTREAQNSYADMLSDYYVAHGNSWHGAERRLNGPPFNGPTELSTYVLLDQAERVIVSNDHEISVGSVLPSHYGETRTPIFVKGEQVGTLLQIRGPAQPPQAPRAPRAPTLPGLPMHESEPGDDLTSQFVNRPQVRFVWGILRGFVFAGIGLMSVLVLLAAFFAQRLSHPIRGITNAAQQLAAGQLDAQAPGARVRELDNLAQAFNNMAQSLARADQQRRQLTADIAHELRTPLTIIKGRLEGLQDGVYEATPEEIERLLGEVAMLERLIEDLRLLALAETGQLPLYPEPIEPSELLQSVSESFANQAEQQDISIQVQAPPDLPMFEADPQRLNQVFANLITNALRHTPSGGTITLQAERGEAQTITFHVRDSGQGIAAEHLPLIFDRFYRADRSRTRGSGGSGLGLAITKQIVIAHGGSISAQSTEHVGTTITIVLPISGEYRSNSDAHHTTKQLQRA